MPFFPYKRYLVHSLKGMEKNEIALYAKQYYLQRIVPHYIEYSINKIKELKSQGFKLFLISAACDEYLRFFCEEYDIDVCISSRLEYKNGKCTGRLDGKDVVGTEKVKCLESYLDIQLKPSHFSFGMTDSYSDLPILKLCRNKLVISNRIHQAWVTEDMEEYIWQ